MQDNVAHISKYLPKPILSSPVEVCGFHNNKMASGYMLPN